MVVEWCNGCRELGFEVPKRGSRERRPVVRQDAVEPDLKAMAMASGPDIVRRAVGQLPSGLEREPYTMQQAFGRKVGHGAGGAR
jgi:hypothetical protein